MVCQGTLRANSWHFITIASNDRPGIAELLGLKSHLRRANDLQSGARGGSAREIVAIRRIPRFNNRFAVNERLPLC